MSVKRVGGFWCDFCGPVAGEKTTHRARGVAGFLAAGVTGGASLLAAVPGRYHCPNCGGPVRPATVADYELLDAQASPAELNMPPAAPAHPPPHVAWRDVPVEEVPPWRQRDRERLDRSERQAGGNGSPHDLIEHLDRLAALHASGVLTEEEFTAAKRRLLGNDPRP